MGTCLPGVLDRELRREFTWEGGSIGGTVAAKKRGRKVEEGECSDLRARQFRPPKVRTADLSNRIRVKNGASGHSRP